MANWQRIDIYVSYPQELGVDEVINEAGVVLSRYQIGGYSIIPIAGAWDGVPEHSLLIRRFTDNPDADCRTLKLAAQDLIWRWNQDSALVNVESANVDFILNFRKDTY